MNNKMNEKITKSINLDDFIKNIKELLITESIIKFKKENNIKLNKTEYFIDNYMIKPSTILKLIENNTKKNI